MTSYAAGEDYRRSAESGVLNVDREISIVISEANTSIHEAGHAVVSRVLGLGWGSASIEAQDSSLGRVISDQPETTSQAWDDVGKIRYVDTAFRAHVIATMAGVESELAILGMTEGGDDDDRRQITIMLENLSSERPYKNLESRLRRHTRRIVQRHAKSIVRVADLLRKHRHLDREAVDAAVVNQTSMTLDAWRSLMRNLDGVGESKPIGYLPLQIIKTTVQLSPAYLAAAASSRGLEAALFGPGECCVESGALYLFSHAALSQLLSANAKLLVDGGLSTDPRHFIACVATVWFETDHPIFPVVKEAFALPEGVNFFAGMSAEKQQLPKP